MIPWTHAAQGEWQRYCSGLRPELKASGADPQEVIDDLERHLTAEAAKTGLSAVTELDLRQLLARIGAPEPATNPASTPTKPESNPAPRKLTGAVMTTLLLLIGAALPAVTLAIESFTHMCAAAFFDPLPTVGHGLLIGFMVAANWMTWNAVRENNSRWRKQLGWANGAAIAIAAFYALLFIPLVVPGVFAIIVFGWGLLPLSPLLALIAAVLLRNRLRALAGDPAPALPGFWRGMLLGVLAISVVEAPVILTRVGMQMAISESARTRQVGIGWLRRAGMEDIMLRACYGYTQGAQSMDLRGVIISGDQRVLPKRAREIFYRVTGIPFNSVPAPAVRTGRGIWADLEDWTWDSDHGGDKVGGRIRGLTMNCSRLDTIVDPDAAWSYSEWILEFQNEAIQEREARAQILLPPGGVVSRLTLWVNDEEREAAFAGRSHVREAYQKIAVQQRRDPVLVTTAGPDRIMMQCFPVPARGGTMKVRIGITAPLVMESLSAGIVRLPMFLERNFSIPEGIQHSIWVNTAGPAGASSTWLEAERTEAGGTALHGHLTNQQLISPDSLILVERNPDTTEAWAADARSGEGVFTRQSLLEGLAVPPERLVVVVDGSREMTSHLSQIASALHSLDGAIPVTLLETSDGVVTLADFPAKAHGSLTNPVEAIQWLQPVGGQDNVPALIKARELASNTAGSAILWIHTPQPILISSPEALLQAYERKSDGPPIYELQTAAGSDLVINKLNALPALHSIPRMGDLKDDLERLFNSWSTGRGQLAFQRQRLEHRRAAMAGSAVETSPQISRLWALEEVRRLRETGHTADAVDLAALYQIVTPVSGAVVLENARQYQETGLQPVNPQSVPAIPEPSAISLLVLALGALLARRRRRL